MRTAKETIRHRKEMKKYQKKYYERFPWMRTLGSIQTRCNNKTRRYYKLGIKNYLTADDLKFLWFRDKAYLLKRPSIHRKNSYGNYTIKNCKYIELLENLFHAGKASYKNYRYNQLCRIGKRKTNIIDFRTGVKGFTIQIELSFYQCSYGTKAAYSYRIYSYTANGQKYLGLGKNYKEALKIIKKEKRIFITKE